MEKQKEYNLRCLLAKVRYYMRKGVGQAPTAGKQTQQKQCRTFSHIGVELEKSYSRTRSEVGSERVKDL
jgi:hypothetical protein